MPDFDDLGCKWQENKRAAALPYSCAMVVGDGDVRMVKESDAEAAACGEGEPQCLWLMPGETAIVRHNALSSEETGAWILDWSCDAPPTCEEVYSDAATWR